MLAVFALLAWPVMNVMQRLVDKLQETVAEAKEKWRFAPGVSALSQGE